jgi:hypothetical protein
MSGTLIEREGIVDECLLCYLLGGQTAFMKRNEEITGKEQSSGTQLFFKTKESLNMELHVEYGFFMHCPAA